MVGMSPIAIRDDAAMAASFVWLRNALIVRRHNKPALFPGASMYAANRLESRQKTPRAVRARCVRADNARWLTQPGRPSRERPPVTDAPPPALLPRACFP